MIIYGEFLFVENYITTFILLILTGLLTGRNPNLKLLALGSVVGALSSFMIFLRFTPLISVIARTSAGFLCVFVAFGPKNILIRAAVYFVLTFISGGMVMALLLWMQQSAINHQGVVYMESVTYFKLLSMGVLAFGFTYWFVKLVRKNHIGKSVLGEVRIEICKNVYEFKGYVDSGNYLREPISGKEVILIDRKGAERLTFKPLDLPERFALIPYKSVGVEDGMLEGVRLDKVTFGSRIKEGVYLAFYQGYFDKYEVLLSKDFLEGGLLEKDN